VSRFDVFEEMRRRGIPVAFPQGWDGRPRPPDGREVSPSRPMDGGPVVPAFFDATQRRAPTRLGGRSILFPSFGGVASPVAAGPRSPGGGLMECDRPATTVRPEGSLARCVVPGLKDTAWVGPPQLAAEVGRRLPRTSSAAGRHRCGSAGTA
jgi:hypothetical protein